MTTLAPTPSFEVSYFARYKKPEAEGKTSKDLIRLCAGKTNDPLLILGSDAIRRVLSEEMRNAGYKPPVLAMVEKLPAVLQPSTFLPEQGDSA